MLCWGRFSNHYCFFRPHPNITVSFSCFFSSFPYILYCYVSFFLSSSFSPLLLFTGLCWSFSSLLPFPLISQFWVYLDSSLGKRSKKITLCLPRASIDISVSVCSVTDYPYTTRVWNHTQRSDASIYETGTWKHHCIFKISGKFLFFNFLDWMKTLSSRQEITII